MVIGAHSKRPEVFPVKTMTAEQTIQILLYLFLKLRRLLVTIDHTQPLNSMLTPSTRIVSNTPG